ncbi:hypothetical protein [Spiroplasma endosymbiont of Nebria brevicollis]|uniref:hypothetical protein n=1 Tax=Spiroplasma endosymbiont of Nebria brevicollis TaxID=3066284 RepID=UPI00313AD6C8
MTGEESYTDLKFSQVILKGQMEIRDYFETTTYYTHEKTRIIERSPEVKVTERKFQNPVFFKTYCEPVDCKLGEPQALPIVAKNSYTNSSDSQLNFLPNSVPNNYSDAKGIEDWATLLFQQLPRA